MADLKFSKQGKGEERALARREEYLPSLFSLAPSELFGASPFTLMRRLTDDLDRAFWSMLRGREETGNWMPLIEVSEKDGKIKVVAELPGLNKDDVKVEVSDGNLVIQGERRQEQEEKREGYYHSERSYGHFYRSIPLPEQAKIEQAQAEFKNGVLEVTVPVPESARKGREIPIRTGGEETGTTKKTQAA